MLSGRVRLLRTPHPHQHPPAVFLDRPVKDQLNGCREVWMFARAGALNDARERSAIGQRFQLRLVEVVFHSSDSHV